MQVGFELFREELRERFTEIRGDIVEADREHDFWEEYIEAALEE